MSTDLTFIGDHGEKRIPGEVIENTHWRELRAFELAVTEFIETNPGFEINREYDIFTGETVIRWRTRNKPMGTETGGTP